MNNWPGTSVEGNISPDIKDPPPQPSRGTCLPRGYSNSGMGRALENQAIAPPVAIVVCLFGQRVLVMHIHGSVMSCPFFAGVGGMRECVNVENEKVKKEVNDQ